MNFILGFLAGITAAGVLLAYAKHKQYISFGKGERADKVDDDLKAARDAARRNFEGTPE